MFDNDSSTQTLTLEEQLFVVEQIDLSVSVCGSTQLQQFRDLLKQHLDYIDDDEGIDMNKLENKLYNVSESIIDEFSSKSTMLLLLLKSYLKRFII